MSLVFILSSRWNSFIKVCNASALKQSFKGFPRWARIVGVCVSWSRLYNMIRSLCIWFHFIASTMKFSLNEYSTYVTHRVSTSLIPSSVLPMIFISFYRKKENKKKNYFILSERLARSKGNFFFSFSIIYWI